jgi:hypothetical protein
MFNTIKNSRDQVDENRVFIKEMEKVIKRHRIAGKGSGLL